MYAWDGVSFRLIGGQSGFGVYNAGNGLLLTGGVFRVDTLSIATILRLNKVRDSISGLLGNYALRTTTLTAGNGLLGGGDLSANRSFSVDTAIVLTRNNRNKLKDSVYASLNNYTPTSRNITTSFGLLGGGNLTTDRTISADSIALQTRLRGIKLVDSTMALVDAAYTPQTRDLTAGFGLLGGGNLSANRTFSADSFLISTRARTQKIADSILGIS